MRDFLFTLLDNQPVFMGLFVLAAACLLVHEVVLDWLFKRAWAYTQSFWKLEEQEPAPPNCTRDGAPCGCYSHRH